MHLLKHRKKAPGDKRRPAFTLIELLIVVAIIAILAAIAVPNFLQAQVRAKVSRVLNDLRTMRTGIESYAVDYVSYPRMTWGAVFDDRYIYSTTRCEEIFGTLMQGPGRDCMNNITGKGSGGSITTPIAYLNSLPQDPFVQSPSGATSSLDALLYTYWYTKTFSTITPAEQQAANVTNAYVPVNDQLEFFEYELGKYVLWSIGPAGEEGFGGRPFFLPYDPTNGTNSTGSVFVSQKLNSPGYVDYIGLEP